MVHYQIRITDITWSSQKKNTPPPIFNELIDPPLRVQVSPLDPMHTERETEREWKRERERRREKRDRERERDVTIYICFLKRKVYKYYFRFNIINCLLTAFYLDCKYADCAMCTLQLKTPEWMCWQRPRNQHIYRITF